MSKPPMSEAFHDWLDQCPVQWHRVAVDHDDPPSATYTFIEGDGL